MFKNHSSDSRKKRNCVQKNDAALYTVASGLYLFNHMPCEIYCLFGGVVLPIQKKSKRYHRYRSVSVAELHGTKNQEILSGCVLRQWNGKSSQTVVVKIENNNDGKAKTSKPSCLWAKLFVVHIVIHNTKLWPFVIHKIVYNGIHNIKLWPFVFHKAVLTTWAKPVQNSFGNKSKAKDLKHRHKNVKIEIY